LNQASLVCSKVRRNQTTKGCLTGQQWPRD